MGVCTFSKLSSASQAAYWTGLVATRTPRPEPGVDAVGAATAYYANPEGRALFEGAHDHEHGTGYYDGHGEKPGTWFGGACANLGLEGEVDAEAFHALLEGKNPGTGNHLQARPKHDATGELVYDTETGEVVMELPWFLRGKKDRCPGFDLTFSLDKDKTLLWALGTPELAGIVEAAHDEGVRRAMAYIEANAGRVRRGFHGRDPKTGEEMGEQYRASLVGAAFQHRTSRAGDPELHTHVVLANVALGPDGRYTALDGIELYDHYRVAGSIYNAHVRDALEESLGISHTVADDKGIQRIKGFDPKLAKAFSKRRAMIEEAVRERGGDIENAEHREAGNLSTRQGKEGGATTTELREKWLAEAGALGIDLNAMWADVWAGGQEADREQAAATAANVQRWAEHLRAATALGGQPWTSSNIAGAVVAAGADRRDVPKLVDALLRSEWSTQAEKDLYALDLITRNSSTFTRRDLVRKLAEMGTLNDLDERVEAALTGFGAVLLSEIDRHGAESNGRTYRTRQWAGVYTTPEVLAAERRLLAAALEGRDAALAVTDMEVVEAVFAKRPTLEVDQREMVEHLLTNGCQVSVVVGLAGAGKTYALDAAREGWEAAGMTVIGCSTAAVAAAGLESDANIESSTIASLLIGLNSGRTQLAPNTVIVVDEAGMTSTRDLDQLVRHAKKADAKVVWVGDHYQLSSVSAGGMFAEVIEQNPDLVTHLTSNKRQANEWERDLLARLRKATPEQADGIVREYVSRERLAAEPDRDEIVARMVRDYWDVLGQDIADQRTGELRTATALMLAVRHADVDALNQAAVDEALRRGLLSEEARVEFGNHGWYVGQKVLTTKNVKTRGVLNGYTGVVEGVVDRASRWEVTVAVPGIPGETVTFETKRELTAGDSFVWQGRGKLSGQAVTVVTAEPREDSMEPHLAVALDGSDKTVYLSAEYAEKDLSAGYAMTVHRAQGRTVDAGLVMGSGMTRESLYVAMSRGRGVAKGDEDTVALVQNRLYTVGNEAVLETDPEQEFGQRLRTDRVTAVTNTGALLATMAEDYWDAANPAAAATRAAQERLKLAEQHLNDLRRNPDTPIEKGQAAVAARDEAAAMLTDLQLAPPVAPAAPPVMVALRRADVAQLNAWAVQEGVTRGELSGERVEFGDREWYVGQRAMATRTDTHRDLARGQVLTVEGVEASPSKWTATITLPRGRTRTMSWSTEKAVGDEVTIRGEQGIITAVEATDMEDRLVLRDQDGRRVSGNAAWAARLIDGYAVTVTRAADVAEDGERLVYAAGIEEEAQAAIKERAGHRWYVIGKPEQLTLTPDEQAAEVMLNELGAQAKRSGAELSATAVAREKVETLDSLTEMQQERHTCATVLGQCPQGAEVARVRAEAAVRKAQVGLAAATGPGGTPDAAAQWTARLRAAEADLAAATVGPNGEPAQTDLDRAAWMAANQGWADRFRELTESLDTAAGLTLAALEMDPPPYAPPMTGDTPLDRKVWREKMLVIEQTRIRLGVEDLGSPLGQRPRGEIERSEWERAAFRLAELEQEGHAPRPQDERRREVDRELV